MDQELLDIGTEWG